MFLQVRKNALFFRAIFQLRFYSITNIYFCQYFIAILYKDSFKCANYRIVKADLLTVPKQKDF